jgi:MoaA/NifB/PqqE/SkfB family radical SAM enzyme
LISSEDLEEFREIIEQLMAHQKKYNNIMTTRKTLEKSAQFFKEGSFPNCRTGVKFFNVNPDGTYSPCGLIIKDFKSPRELYEKFSKVNTCSYCYTSIRANCEKSFNDLATDALKLYINSKKTVLSSSDDRKKAADPGQFS